jgi:hypothetical protein
MKIKIAYSLSEKTLEKDIDKFIRDAKRGVFNYDYQYGQEGLKIIKFYFRLVEEEFKKNNYLVARTCYKKLLFILLQREYDYFNYNDIMSKFNAEKIIGLYFFCLVKTCNSEELFEEYLEYLKVKNDYYYESAEKTILEVLPYKEKLAFIKKVEKKSKNVTERDYAFHDLIYLQLDIAKQKKDKKKYISLCQKFIKIVGPEQIKEFTS